jgi:GNAT superfamily N-acetyltransferase
VLEEQLLDPKRHDRKAFTCGKQELDEYLQRYASQHNKSGLSTVRVLVDSAKPSTILGYYSLSAAQISVDELDEASRKALSRYPLPCFRMGRLARHVHNRGQGLGEMLIGLAVRNCLQARKSVGAYALIVDAKDDEARQFYEHYGFSVCQHMPMTLYLCLPSS